MSDQLIITVMLICSLSGTIMAATVTIGATIYDVRFAKRLRQFLHHPHAKLYQRRPLMTIIVSSHNDSRFIMRCIDSIFTGTYRKIEVLVVDHASTDSTKRIVKGYISDHPKKSVRLIVRRKVDDKQSGLVAAFQRHGSGQLVMLIESDCMVHNQALRAAVRHMNEYPQLQILNANCQVVPAWSIVGLYQKYQNYLHQHTEKFASILGIESAARDGVVFRSDSFIRYRKSPSAKSQFQSAPMPQKVYFAKDVVINAPTHPSLYHLFRRQYRLRKQFVGAIFASIFRGSPVPRFRNSLFFLGLSIFSICTSFFILTVPILLSYFTYLAFWLHEPTLLFLSGAILSVLLLLAVWDDEQVNARKKIVYSLGVPMTYGIFFLDGLVRMLTILWLAFSTSLMRMSASDRRR